MFICPKCGGELLFVVTANNYYRVDPATGEFRRSNPGGITYFKCLDCNAGFAPESDALPFKYDPDKVQAVMKEV
ncbi:MAG: hypothetical protein AB1700_04175 [Bacillota bacterium]